MAGSQTARWIMWVLLATATASVAIINARFIFVANDDSLHRAYEHLGARSTELYAHLYMAIFALFAGALPFYPGLQNRAPLAYRRIAGAYLLAVMISSIVALRLSINVDEGPMTMIGFTVLAVLWFASAGLAALRLYQRQTKSHTQWMIRNYALTLTSLTFRLELHAAVLLGADFDTVYEPLRVLQFIPNLLLAELLIRGIPSLRINKRDLRSASPQ